MYRRMGATAAWAGRSSNVSSHGRQSATAPPLSIERREGRTPECERFMMVPSNPAVAGAEGFAEHDVLEQRLEGIALRRPLLLDLLDGRHVAVGERAPERVGHELLDGEAQHLRLASALREDRRKLGQTVERRPVGQ